MNHTVTSSQALHTSSSGLENELDEVLGLPAVDFYAIHYTALVVLSCNGTVSCGVLISLVACSKTRFRERPIGERLVVYLASCDLIFRWGMFTKYIHIQSHGYKFSVAWMAVVYPHGTYFVTLFHNAIQWSILRVTGWDMMTSSNGNIFRVTGPLCGEFTGPGEFPAQRPVTRSFDVFFDLRPNKRLSKQPWG